jgi:hypothetical protein
MNAERRIAARSHDGHNIGTILDGGIIETYCDNDMNPMPPDIGIRFETTFIGKASDTGSAPPREALSQNQHSILRGAFPTSSHKAVFMRNRSGNNPTRRIIDRATVTEDQVAHLLKRARYVGSGHHKRCPADYGLERTNPRPTRSLCDLRGQFRRMRRPHF